jgi:hypothetical protein
VNYSDLLQRTAARYEAAVQTVLSEWSPECGCGNEASSKGTRPGTAPCCEACPCLSVFEQRVRDEILRVHQSTHPSTTKSDASRLTGVIYETTECIYFSQSQV